jgi:hypothetical protein
MSKDPNSAQIAELRKALDDAATSLEALAKLSGKKVCAKGFPTFLDDMLGIRFYAYSRAKVARESLNKTA